MKQIRNLLLVGALLGSLAGSASALTLQQIGDARTDPAFLSRVRARLCQAAPAIVNESALTANHAARVALAARILAEPDLWASRFAVVVAGQPTPAAQSSLANVTDAHITSAVDGLLDTFALSFL